MDDAHRIVKREILKLGTQTNLVLRLDGLPSVEKDPIQAHRENLRKKAVKRADKCLRELEVCVGKSFACGNTSSSTSENTWARPSIGLNSYRQRAPLTSTEQPSMPFSERELAWADISWLLITEMLSNIGSREPRKEPKDYKNSASVMDLSMMQEHDQSIRQANFDPMTYEGRGYVHRGSIRTNSFRLHLSAFKLKELHSVRYRRLLQNVLPLRIISTAEEVEYYLTEVRNIVKTQQDVTNLWGCAPDRIKVLGLDLGQACVVGTSALLSKNDDSGSTTTGPGRKDDDVDMSVSSEVTTPIPTPPTYYNLAVKQKAVFEHRR
ncbi:hypothetical protein BC939DRAFT_505877 [Gamsiella multidivaricata]|uniref:uncharacterized protein n=1 Tax=Gamsiella multidivaricata TaxID=101098 RepID=UPI002220D4D4|nr:uncharacterized protein BC939DRAFT_505877 [Gamsiella multidivaricata]KAG0366459.1 hypothetical protein BGZ54_005341 [Gamsiella multidivaricata]KAI7819206.1 hypothetical protein BC939DRAFT_505877 [Gamsiella multidivaricata]